LILPDERRVMRVLLIAASKATLTLANT
jgi:hypothetical protein